MSYGFLVRSVCWRGSLDERSAVDVDIYWCHMVSYFGLFAGEDRLMRGMSLMLIYIVGIWFLSLVCLLVRVA